MRRALLFCAAISVALACGDNVTEPIPERTKLDQNNPLFATTTTEDGLSISTDKDDYQPGDVVHLTGYGWQPGDVLDIVLTDDPLTHDPHTWTVNVDEQGMFHDSTYVVDQGDLNVTFTLVATSRSTGRSLTVVFTDNIPPGSITVTLNGGASVSVSPGATISLAVTARVTSQGGPSAPLSWKSTGWVLLATVATEPAGKLANCVDTPNVTGTTGNGTEATATFNITAPTNPGIYDLWVALSDADGTGATACGGTGGLSQKKGFVGSVTVQVPANQPPVLNAIGNKTIGEEAELAFTATATDEDVASLQFSLANPATGTFPTGAAITAGGAFTWTPTELQGPGTYRVKVVVTDNGSLTDEEEIEITVSEVNKAPVLDAIGNKSVNEGSLLSFSATATDPDRPSNTLAFSLDGAPAGASITSGGAFTWTPADDDPTGTLSDGNAFKVVVTDDGAPPLSDDETITVTVNNVAPSIGTLTKSDGTALPSSVIVGGTLNIKVPFTDPGNDTYTAEIDCGEGDPATSLGTVTSGFTAPCTFNSVGSKTVTVKVTDDDTGVGQTSFTILVKYNFDGLFAPVDRLPTINSAKAGQAIPLKWRLTNANGEPITDLTAVNIKIGSLACGTTPYQDAIEEYAAGSSGLQNLGDGYYQFNWKTPGGSSGYANQCKSIGLDFIAYVEYPLASFQFKK